MLDSPRVVIIGAGVAGMTTAYALSQLGISFRVLEASGRAGGRLEADDTFADFPIPLGAEWIETDLAIFGEIVGDPDFPAVPETFPDGPDHKFHRSSWMNFFETHVLPSIEGHIDFNEAVVGIDYAGDGVIIDTNGAQFAAEQVVVAVPLSVLKNPGIEFTPPLPATKQAAIDSIEIWGGFKAFFEFSQPFFDGPDEFAVPVGSGHKLYYEASWNQDSPHHIYALFCVG